MLKRLEGLAKAFLLFDLPSSGPHARTFSVSIHNPKKEGRLARARFSAAFMSDTKWRKLFAAVSGQPCSQMTVKFIDVSEPKVMAFPPSLRCPYAYMDTIEFGPVELRAIEWLELPINAEPLMTSIGKFPVESTKSGSRFTGYRT